MKTGLNKAFWLLSFVFVLGGLTILATRLTTAATSADYTTSFTVSKWRNYSGGGTGDEPYGIAVGPAEWRVTGTSGTTNFCEVWQATAWDDAIPSVDGRMGQFAIYSDKGNSRCSNGNPGSLYTCNSGLYGVGVGSLYNVLTNFGHSWPTGWQISGYINKSCP